MVRTFPDWITARVVSEKGLAIAVSGERKIIGLSYDW